MVQRGPPRLSWSSALATAARRSGVFAEQISSECQSPLNGSPMASKGAAPALLRISSAKNLRELGARGADVDRVALALDEAHAIDVGAGHSVLLSA